MKELHPIQSYKHSDLDNFSPRSGPGQSAFAVEQEKIAAEEKAKADALKDAAEELLDREPETAFEREMQVRAGKGTPFPVPVEARKDPTPEETDGSSSHSTPSSSGSTPTSLGKNEQPAGAPTTQTPSSPSVGKSKE